MTNLIFTHDDCRYHGDKRPREAANDTAPPGGYTHPEQPPRLQCPQCCILRRGRI